MVVEVQEGWRNLKAGLYQLELWKLASKCITKYKELNFYRKKHTELNNSATSGGPVRVALGLLSQIVRFRDGTRRQPRPGEFYPATFGGSSTSTAFPFLSISATIYIFSISPPSNPQPNLH